MDGRAGGAGNRRRPDRGRVHRDQRDPGRQLEVLSLQLRSLTPGPRQRRPGVSPGQGRRQVALGPRRLDRHRRGQRPRPGERAQQGAPRRPAWRRARSTRCICGECDRGERAMTEPLTGSQILCRALLEEGVELVFGYPGGAIMPFYHALPEYPGLRHVLVRHEQAAAHAADGYARATGRAGVCVATSGPGATNLVTGLATAHMDSTPVVAITGQVPRAMIGRDAFQETDIIGITQPITKHSVLVEDVEELADAVREALAVAVEGRPGPVLVDVPKDVQNPKAEWRDGGAAGAACPDEPSAVAALPPPPRRGGAAARGRRAAAHHGRPRRDPVRAPTRSCGPGGADRHTGDHHPAGHQRLSRVAPAASRHAGHARRGAREPRHPAGRSDLRRRAAVRRPGHRQPRGVRAGRAR